MIALAFVLAGLLPVPLQGEKAPQARKLLVRFRAEAVDGVDELVVKGRKANIRHLEWEPIRGLDVDVVAAPPESDALRIVVRAKSGRAAVTVVESPSRANDGKLCVRIDDGSQGGAAPLAFELWAVPKETSGHALDVVLITIDSLRPDHLGCYGFERATSPNIDAFARGAVRFTNAFSTSSFTPPSHASLLTSRAVGDHNLLTWNELPEEQVTLPEVLVARGWRTGASVNLALLSGHGLGQGVEWQREGEREARTIVGDALEFLRSGDDRPFFLWLHLYDVHRPYGRVPGWSDRFAAARAGIGDGEGDYGLKPEKVRERGLTVEDLTWIADRYDAGIAYADAQLGPLLAELATPAHASRTMVVITADHGENLLEHPECFFAHDPFLFSAVGRVPLLILYPDGLGAGEVRGDPVSLIDVAPTVLATLGLGAPPTFNGRSLRELETGARWPERELYQECWGWERLAGVRTGHWFVLRDLERKTVELYDLREDPDEQRALDPAKAREANVLVKKLDAFAERRPVDETLPKLDPELLKRLKELGYVGDDH
jgi:hypothetical protein